MAPLHPRIRDWFETRSWSPFSFQEETWAHYLHITDCLQTAAAHALIRLDDEPFLDDELFEPDPVPDCLGPNPSSSLSQSDVPCSPRVMP